MKGSSITRLKWPPLVLFAPFTYSAVFSIFVYLPLSSKALINKRKLHKPVGTSEKEAADKKKEKEEQKKIEVEKETEEVQQEEKQDEEVAAKLSARTATTSSDLVRTSFVKVWYRIRAWNNIITRPFDHSPRETPTPTDRLPP